MRRFVRSTTSATMRSRNAEYAHALGNIFSHEISITSNFDIARGISTRRNCYLLSSGRRHSLSALSGELLCSALGASGYVALALLS